MEKTVAEQEENIKRLRVVEEAERTRQAVVIHAEAEAQENLVKDIKAAEAAEAAAKFKAREELVLAEARQQAAELDTRAKIRLAEGLQAEAAAAGLAEVQVRERDAEAIEKVGRAPRSPCERREGRWPAGRGACARSSRARPRASPRRPRRWPRWTTPPAGTRSTGCGWRRRRRSGSPDSTCSGRSPRRRPRWSPPGWRRPNIDIVGGDSVFFDRLLSSISLGKSVDGFVAHSDVAQASAKPWLDGTAELHRRPDPDARLDQHRDVQNLTLSAFLLQQMRAGGADQGKLQELLKAAQRLGVAETPLTALAGPRQRAGE